MSNATVNSAITVRQSYMMRSIRFDRPSAAYPLTTDVGILFPDEGPVGPLRLLVSADAATNLTVELWDIGCKAYCRPLNCRLKMQVSIRSGEQQGLNILSDDGMFSDEPYHAFLIVRANPAVSLFQWAGSLPYYQLSMPNV
ncbi:hypothetical protein M3194_06555 [Paenibacillus glycanilyticus]|uniref:hypothetical protein n=1 Tax=Paenibacillus glycanilyticus TaxID=126569 RepID=UPI002041A4DC|nr:hypothetical protein [Paenibacillus glycanilyticus]MCM3627021.1 hypothetical protein [Paenibacillus glycanilyticus]